MQQSKIINVSGFSIDLSQIKAIKVNTNSTLGDTNVLVIDFNLRYEYIFNPNKNKYIKQKIDDNVSITYVDYNAAVEAMESLTSEWQECLDSLKESN
ncbi:hypothetical protein ABIB40_003112 [Pedobacter sp. UYP30]|uniref:hypothetical protein n=1 Tax=Pedobacter sp. UYP30 TaxID=1756400 RepID=UPI0033908191